MLNTKLVRALRKNKRKENGMKFSQVDMAEALGISARTYGRIERGETKPNIEVAKRIALVLGKTLEELCLPDPDQVSTENNHNNVQLEGDVYYERLQQQEQALQAANEKLQEKDELIERIRNKNAQLKETAGGGII